MENNRIVSLAKGLRDLHERWNPHPWQVPIGRALFYEDKKDIGAQCGRSAGKTDTAGYCSWRWGYENPGSENYIIEPMFNQAREILWASNRIQSFGPPEWISSVNNTECRINFKNGSFIKLEGSERTEKLRGIKPRGITIWDELKDIRKATIDAMDPNRARYNSPALYLGTPPEFHNHYIDIMDSLKSDPRALFVHAPTSANPLNSVDWLARKKKQLIDSGQEEIWLREYEAIFVKGGSRSIFPQATKHPYDHLDLPMDLNHWNSMVIADPGTMSVFGVLFILYNPFQKQLWCMREIYETKMEMMRVRPIMQAVDEKRIKGAKKEDYLYDSAAAWFANEANEVDKKKWWVPVDKSEFGKEEGISLIRDLFTQGRLHISAECPKLRWELENYITDENGRVPKENDHLIDCLRYALNFIGPSIRELDPPRGEDPLLAKRAYRMEDEMDFSGEEEI